MERRSTKHSGRLDDELKKEVESLERGAPVEAHSEEFRDQEGPGDDERLPSSRTAPPDELGPDDVAARTELSRHLRASVFPADREALLAEARENNAPDAVIAKLSGLPAGHTFATVYEVWEALGGAVEMDETYMDGNANTARVGRCAAIKKRSSSAWWNAAAGSER